jgi:hypothetical protein
MSISWHPKSPKKDKVQHKYSLLDLEFFWCDLGDQKQNKTKQTPPQFPE